MNLIGNIAVIVIISGVWFHRQYGFCRLQALSNLYFCLDAWFSCTLIWFSKTTEMKCKLESYHLVIFSFTWIVCNIWSTAREDCKCIWFRNLKDCTIVMFLFLVVSARRRYLLCLMVGNWRSFAAMEKNKVYSAENISIYSSFPIWISDSKCSTSQIDYTKIIIFIL